MVVVGGVTQLSSCPADQERTEAHEEIEAMRRRKEAEKAEEREGTVMVRGWGWPLGRLHTSLHCECSVVVWCC